MKLVIDDSAIRKLEERMGKLMGGGGSSSGSGSSGSESGDSPFKNLLKLTAIAAGIALLVTAVKKIVEKVVEASPALQAMFKLLDASITLILRPFGDFVAFLLKPLLIIFLTKVALPFYKLMQPLMQFLGTSVGNTIAGGANAVIDGGVSLFKGDFEGFMNSLNAFKGIWLTFVDWISDALGLSPELQETLSGFWDFIVGLVVRPEIFDAIKRFWEWFDNLGVPEWVSEQINRFIEWFQNLGVEKLFGQVLEVLFAFAEWFFNLIFDPKLAELIFSFFGFIAGMGVSDIVMIALDLFYGFLEFLNPKEWMWIALIGFQGLLVILDGARNLTSNIIGFFGLIKMIGEYVYKAGQWLGTFYNGSKSDDGKWDSSVGIGEETVQKMATINVNFDGSSGYENEKQKLLELFNEMLK
jgi:hypothetical protein